MQYKNNYVINDCKVILLNRGHMSVDENVELGELLDVYGDLLSEKQKNVTQNYIFNDMSLSEIAQLENVSRVAILDAIKTAKQKLYDYEKKLKLLQIKKTLRNIVNLSEKEIKSEITKLLEDI